MENKEKKPKEKRTVPCKVCTDSDEYCLACREKIKEVVNTFWWD